MYYLTYSTWYVKLCSRLCCRGRNCETLGQSNEGFLYAGSPWRDKISLVILELQEKGVIQILYDKWWKNTGDVCNRDDKNKESKANALGVENIGMFIQSYFLLILQTEIIEKIKLAEENKKILLIFKLCMRIKKKKQDVCLHINGLHNIIY